MAYRCIDWLRWRKVIVIVVIVTGLLATLQLQLGKFTNWEGILFKKAGPLQTPRSPEKLPHNVSNNEKLPRNTFTNVLDIVVAIPRMTDETMTRIGGYSKYTPNKLRERELEFVDCLRRNLQHPVVSRVHILNDQPDYLAKMLKSEPGIDLERINLIKSSKDVTFAELFNYVSSSLQGRFVNVMNADIYLGEDFTRLDWFYLRRTRVMYSLTRKHMKPIPRGCAYNPTSLFDYCENGSVYNGAHDCFLFYVHSPLPEKVLAELRHKVNMYGGENVTIWAFKNVYNFTVLNPCRILSIHHNHCSNVRPAHKYRHAPKNVWLKTAGTVGISDSLYINGLRNSH